MSVNPVCDSVLQCVISGCELCDCDEVGAHEKGTCDKKTGACVCYQNRIGMRCETCAPGINL